MFPIDSGSDANLLFLKCSSRKRSKPAIESGSDDIRLSEARSSIRLVIPNTDSGQISKAFSLMFWYRNFVSQDQRLQIGSLPHPFWCATQPLLP